VIPRLADADTLPCKPSLDGAVQPADAAGPFALGREQAERLECRQQSVHRLGAEAGSEAIDNRRQQRIGRFILSVLKVFSTFPGRVLISLDIARPASKNRPDP
jgi:hypothetical protein